MTEISKDVKVKFLVERRFGSLARFAKTVGNRAGGGSTNFGGLFGLIAPRFPHDEQTVEMAHAYRASLEALDERELDRLFGSSTPTLLGASTHEEFLATANDFELFNDEFFSRANFRRWAQKPYWTADEVVAISLGAEPGVLLLHRARDQGSFDFLVEYRHREDLVRRAIELDVLGEFTRPKTFVDWAKSIDLEIPAGLVEAVEKLAGNAEVGGKDEPPDETPEGKRQPQAFDKELTTRERESLLKIIGAMAIEQYGYNPLAKRSDVVSRIRDDLTTIGLSLDEDTIRQKLKDSASLLDGDVLSRISS